MAHKVHHMHLLDPTSVNRILSRVSFYAVPALAHPMLSTPTHVVHIRLLARLERFPALDQLLIIKVFILQWVVIIPVAIR